MITRVRARLRRLRRLFNRSEWAIRTLGLSRSADAPTSPGLLLIQIDGLGRADFDRALAANRLPFLKTLIERERYRLHDLYAGVPSTTPAVQAELFYGVRTSVPAFTYIDPGTDELTKMFEPEAARELEKRLAAKAEGLTTGGAAYGNIFTGGAGDDEAHYCVSSLVWRAVNANLNLRSALLIALSNPMSVMRTLFLLMVETLLALYDFFRGLTGNFNLAAELKFIPARVAICIGLRELIVIGAKIDLARGLPIVQVNFGGYDEQSHRRGPHAAFAHWALRGIDAAIKRLWTAAQRSSGRDYHVWIYSDHGQEAATPYARLTGTSIETAVRDSFDPGSTIPLAGVAAHGIQTQRVRTLRRDVKGKVLRPHATAERSPERESVRVVAMGPLGLVYLPAGTAVDARLALARKLVADARVPAVITRDASGRLIVHTPDDEFALAGNVAALVGPTHPFVDVVGEDIEALCEHPAVGDLILCGWRHGVPPLTFAIENGAHGGFAPRETNGIALLDTNYLLPDPAARFVRAADIRAAARRLLGREALSPAHAPRRHDAVQTVRLATYNVHGCIGMDGHHSPARIVRVLRALDADILMLQEVELGCGDGRHTDHAELLGTALNMDRVTHATVRTRTRNFGLTILTRRPIELIRAGALPGLDAREPRGAIWIETEVAGRSIQLINTHLGLSPQERRLQIDALMGQEWFGSAESRGPVVVLGDFNAGPRSYTYRQLTRRCVDAQRHVSTRRPLNTWFSGNALRRIDHIVYTDTPELELIDVDVPGTRDACIASDHLPVVCELAVSGESRI